jgi:TetR/AcrR family transcriptional regulator, transcriptional repressor for nem operon
MRFDMPRKSDKREKLLKAARSLIHRQGFQQTSLAHIAEESGVPLGNVYYYFKTKDDIARAVVEDRTGRFLALTEEWELNPDPARRLLSFLDMPKAICQSIVRHGCPVGSLSQELSKKEDSAAMANPLKTQLDWVTQQFQLLCPDSAEKSGRKFIVSLQGASLLANSLNDPDILLDQIEQLKCWIQSFSS